VREKDMPGTGTGEEKSFIEGFGLCSVGAGGNPGVVDVRNGRIIRIRPLHYDAAYSVEELKPWRLEARGKVFKPAMKSLLPPFSLGYKKRVYSPNRILYPLKRVDFDHKGERNIENRGKSGYVRISWDEALDIIVSELRRVIEKYGPTAILAQSDGHRILHVRPARLDDVVDTRKFRHAEVGVHETTAGVGDEKVRGAGTTV